MHHPLVRINSDCYGFFTAPDDRFDTPEPKGGTIDLDSTDSGILLAGRSRGWRRVLLPVRGTTVWIHRDALLIIT